MTFEKFWKDNYVEDDDLYLAINKFAQDAYNAGRESQEGRIEGLRKALKICSLHINTFYLCMKQANHEQSIHEDEHSLWYARDLADQALEADKEFEK